jgi:hypothetical protein
MQITQENQKEHSLSILASPGFLASLIVLLANDYYLKHHFPGFITGKLSDLAGLSLVGLLVTALSPKRSPYLLLLTALLFVFWKSPLSGPIIALWNTMGLFHVGRVVDYTDNAALLVLPLVWTYSRTCKPLCLRRVFIYPTIALTLLAIMGTSPAWYRTRLEIPDKPDSQMMTDSTMPDSRRGTELLSTIHDIAVGRGFSCTECEASDFYRRYKTGDAILEVHYDPEARKAYIGIFVSDPFRVNYKKQQERVEALRKEIEMDLHKRSYSSLQADTVHFLQSSYESSLQIKSATGGFPFFFGNSGAGNRDIMEAHSFIENYLSPLGFERTAREYCRPAGTNVSPGFPDSICRNYIAGRVIGPEERSRSTMITVSGNVDWSGTCLRVEFRQIVEDSRIDIDSLATELYNSLKNLLADRAEVSYEVRKAPNKPLR